jgi:starch synthase (maltosyl-transferring)
VQQQRLAFAAFFSAGLLVPVGFELGFRRRLDVVETRADHWEQPSFDLQGFVRDVLTLKRSRPALVSEGHHRALTPLDLPTLVLEKSAGDDRVLILVNKDWHEPHEVDPRRLVEGLEPTAPRLIRPFLGETGGEPLPEGPVRLSPAEVAVVVVGAVGPRPKGAARPARQPARDASPTGRKQKKPKR